MRCGGPRTLSRARRERVRDACRDCHPDGVHFYGRRPRVSVRTPSRGVGGHGEARAESLRRHRPTEPRMGMSGAWRCAGGKRSGAGRTRPARSLVVGPRDQHRSGGHRMVPCSSRRLGGAQRLLDANLVDWDSPSRFESLAEAADIIGSYEDPSRCAALLEDLRLIDPPTDGVRYYADLVAAENYVRLGQATRGLTLLRSIPSGVMTGYPAFHLRRLLSLGFAEWVANRKVDRSATAAAEDLARRQRAGSTLTAAALLNSIGSECISDAVLTVSRRDAALMSVYAEALVTRLADLTIEASHALSAEAASRTGSLDGSPSTCPHGRGSRHHSRCRSLLERFGDQSDVLALRPPLPGTEGRACQPGPWPRARATRRPEDIVEDLGRIRTEIGERELPGTSVRRKALALLTFLLAQPQMSATRDRVLDALWPDQDPGQAANSLHQTCTSFGGSSSLRTQTTYRPGISIMTQRSSGLSRRSSTAGARW